MSCLALNASYEPLMIVPSRRAIRLVLDRKAEVLEEDAHRSFRSVRSHHPFPVVIRLVRYVHVPRRFRRQVTNTFLFARDGYACQYCRRHKRELRTASFSPVTTSSRSRGVATIPGRMWSPACSTCNHRKGNRLPREAGLRLLTRPVEPNHVELVWAVRRVTPIQAKYIRMFFGDDAVPVGPGALSAPGRHGP